MAKTFVNFIGFRYLRSPKQEGFISVITGFSFLGILLAVATLIIVMSVMNGFRHDLLDKIIGMRGHIMAHSQTGHIENYEDVCQIIEKNTCVKSAIALIERQAVVTSTSQARGVGIQAMTQDDLKRRKIITDNLLAGTPEDFQGTNTVFIGRRLADSFYLKVGDTITLMSPSTTQTAFGSLPKQRSFQIAGVFEVGMHEYDKSVVLMPLEAAQSFFNLPKSVSDIEIFIHDADKATLVALDLKKVLPESLKILDWQHGNSTYFQAVEIERKVMFVILTLLIIIAAFNIISGLVMLVKDKTRDIAILRTMGATQNSIMRIFFLNGALIGLSGTLIGLILGVLIATNLEEIRQFIQSFTGSDLFQAEIYFLTRIPAKIQLMDVVGICLLSISLSFFATLYPSWRASRLDPVEALRL